MPKVKVQMLKRHGKFLPGDVVEISKRDLKPMVAMGRVALAVGDGAPKEEPRTAPRPARTARKQRLRRDITETQSPTVEQLRTTYKRRFGEEPDHRWGIPRLTQELGAGRS